MKRHYCAYCGKKVIESKMVCLRFPIIHRSAWVCGFHVYSCHFTQLVYVESAINFTTESLLQRTFDHFKKDL